MFNTQLKNRILVGKANNHIAQSIKSKQMIKLYSAENYMINKQDILLKNNYKAIESVNFFDSVYSPIIKTIMAVCIAFIVILSGINIELFGPTIGSLAAGISLIESLFSPVENLGMELQTLQGATAGIKRANDFLSEQDDEQKLDLTINDIVKNNNVTLKFDDLSFSYDGINNVISNISVTINNGENVTFIGRTGVGKSTLFKLILGIIKGNGKITINDVDVYRIKNEIKPYLLGYVEQSFSFIAGLIKDNITLANKAFTSDDVYNALEFVKLKDIVDTFKNGIDTEFNKSLFSQEQLQLLSIARVMIYKPQILLLDEITASLDIETEKQILSILQKASEKRTILSIPHRKSSIIKSDKIILFENGKIKNIMYN